LEPTQDFGSNSGSSNEQDADDGFLEPDNDNFDLYGPTESGGGSGDGNLPEMITQL
jgi:hypothetical protein